MKFTETELKRRQAKPPDKRTTLHDPKTPGLEWRLTPKGLATWSYRFRAPEGPLTPSGHRRKGTQRYRISLGRFPKVSIAAARRKANGYLEQIENNVNPLDELALASEASKALTLKQLAEIFKTEFLDAGRIRATDKYRRALHTHIVPALGKQSAESVSKSQVSAMLKRALQKRKRADGVIVGGQDAAWTALTVTQKLFTWAAANGHVIRTDNPAQGIGTNVLPSPKSRDRVLSIKEAAAIAGAAASFDNTYYGAFYRLLLLTACRSHEWIDCLWADVDLDAGIMTVQHTKQGNVKVVPLVDSAVEILSALPRVDDFVLARPFSRSSKVLARFRDQVGFTDWTPHDFRRTVASHLADDDESIETIERLLDHTVEKGATKVYVRNKFTRQKRAALESWEAMLNG